MRKTLWAASVFAMLVALTLNPLESRAGIVYTGSGTGTGGEAISGTVEFDLFDTHDFGSGLVPALRITLTNTAATTSFRGNLITGVFFNLTGVGALAPVASAFDGLAGTVQTTTGGATVSNVDIAPAVNATATDGTYQLSNGPFGLANSGADYSAFSHGIATVGMGLTGFSGSDVNGDDYGIFASGSNLTLDGLPATLPVIDTTATFWIAKPLTLTSSSQFTSFRLTYGSLPDNFIDLAPVPEPTTLLLWGTTAAGLGLLRARRKRRQKAAAEIE